MIQIKNNLTGAVGLFQTLSKAFKFLNFALKVIGMKPIERRYLFKEFKRNNRIKFGFGNISVVVSECEPKTKDKTP